MPFKSSNYWRMPGIGWLNELLMLHKPDRMDAVFHGRKDSGAVVTDKQLLSFSNNI